MDWAWWNKHIQQVLQEFEGARFTVARVPDRWGVKQLAKFPTYGNSGAACVSLAMAGGAARVVLLGYDCQWTGGKAHWHGDHPRGLGNAPRPHEWVQRFSDLARDTPETEILNCSRATALDMFPRCDLESVLV